ncbi:hypothetical protein F5Y11DRAFT_59296 [Daldinia sp. FL1419]|nr:hypothetical protein F5Y11DRAFT_59296 [Daldinia sp. FL1419]
MRLQVSQIALAAVAFVGFASAREYAGCFNSPTNLQFNRTHPYQSRGLCGNLCDEANQPVMALTKGTDCFCGQSAPPAEDAVADSLCDSPCSGFAMDMCGGEGFFSVFA